MAGNLYDSDLVLWSERQAELLREAASLRSNEAIDWSNLAEEIETVGRSQTHAMVSRLARIIEHLLKLQFSHAQEPRRVWEASVRGQRVRLTQLLRDSPSLRGRLDELLPDAAELGTAYAVESLLRHGEDGPIDGVQAHGGRYDPADIAGAWLPGGPPP